MSKKRPPNYTREGSVARTAAEVKARLAYGQNRADRWPNREQDQDNPTARRLRRATTKGKRA